MTTLDLSPFTGTENWYRHFTGLLYTDGVKYVADQAGILEVDTVNHTGRLSLYEDSGCPPVLTQDLEYTDFPEASIKFYVENGVLLLPSEH
jgi:hypothetical protein